LGSRTLFAWLSPGDGVATIAQADQQKIATEFLTALFARYLEGWTAMGAYLDNQRPVEGSRNLCSRSSLSTSGDPDALVVDVISTGD
jgi:hypothetical protein